MTAATPAWGTAPVPVRSVRYTVTGFYAATDQRFVEHVLIDGPVCPENARAAEDWAMIHYGGQVGDDGVPCGLHITAVLALVNGEITSVDTYALYLDPNQIDHYTT